MHSMEIEQNTHSKVPETNMLAENGIPPLSIMHMSTYLYIYSQFLKTTIFSGFLSLRTAKQTVPRNPLWTYWGYNFSLLRSHLNPCFFTFPWRVNLPFLDQGWWDSSSLISSTGQEEPPFPPDCGKLCIFSLPTMLTQPVETTQLQFYSAMNTGFQYRVFLATNVCYLKHEIS